VPSVFAAIRAGRVRVVTAPLRPFDKLRDNLQRPFRDLRLPVPRTTLAP
jgi:hypothetical protein